MKGFFFGSFDPPHIGHVNVVATALNSGLVDSVEVIPAFKSVWKNTETPFSLRLIMCRYAFYNILHVKVNPIEEALANNKPLPTHKVIDYLKTIGDEFKIIVTSETYSEIPLWENGEKILKENKFIIVDSSHFCKENLDVKENNIIFAPDITICSTNLREKIQNGKIVKPFIDDSTLSLINKLNLYK